MGEMISMIAHQWRQPLAAISATSSNLSFKLMMDEYDKELYENEIELISDYSQHLSKTIDDFRSFFKEDKETQLISLKKVIEDTLNISKVSLENKNIELITKFEDHKEIQTYPNEVKQVVLNLIKNAEDALLENNISNPKISVSIEQDMECSIIKVKDNAGGIPEDIIQRIFDPYFSTKLEKDGTGLGLYMSKTMIEDHCNGSIDVKNYDNGAQFTIKLKSLDSTDEREEENEKQYA
jgi:signal transduction histidine kinase